MNEIQEIQGNTRGGNNHPPLLRGGFSSRKYVFTLNKYTNTEIHNIRIYLEKNSSKWIFGKEVGENGTPHLQGYMEFKSPKKWRILSENGFSRCWSTSARGTLKQNFDYTTKDGDYFYGGFKIEDLDCPDKKNLKEWMKYQEDKMKLNILSEYENIEWKDIQQQIIDIVEEPENDRKINWIVDDNGNYGKSFLSRYLICKYGGVVVNGKTNDILNSLLNYQIENDYKEPQFVIVDIPRSSSKYTDNIYGIIEKIKDGMIYSGKYEGGLILYKKRPHVIVLSNEHPKMDMMSYDRWNIIKV